jgi:hypothetical protein
MKIASLLSVVLIASSLAGAEGQVFINSEPLGAEIFLQVLDKENKPDLQSMGKKTPALVKLPEGRNLITLRLPKHKDLPTEVDVVGTGIMKPEPFKLELTTYPVDVILLEEGWAITVDKTPQTKDEKPITAPATVQVLEGKHDITLTKDGFEPMTKSITLKEAKETLSVDFSAEKPRKAVKKAAAPQNGPVDLLKIASVKDSINGEWELGSAALSSPSVGPTKLPFKYSPPDEYVLNAIVERVNGNDSLALGLLIDGKQFVVLIDGWESKFSGIEMIAGKRACDNVTRYTGRQVLGIKPSQIQVAVRKALIEVNVNGRKLFAWKPEPDKLSVFADWTIPQKDTIYVGAFNTCFKFTKLEVEPLR